eukprot:COSAG01_NODE_2374_length_7803_cov_5.861241_9_plen_506_part_00
MPPRAKRKRASRPTSPVDSPAASRARGAQEEDAPVLVAVKGQQPLPDSFAAQRQRKVFLDATLSVGGICIAAHKSVLVAYSSYLDGLLTSGLAESSQAASGGGPMVIRDVDGAAVAACVDCMYSGSIALSGATVSAVIQAANLLGITAIEEVACKFFVDRLEPETALDALAFAERMATGERCGQELHSQVLAYVHAHFTECAATPAFVGMAASSLGTLIGSDALCVDSEEAVLSALRRWYEHDVEGRAGALEELVPLVRFPWLRVEAKARLREEPLLLLLSKPKLVQLLLECVPELRDSAVAVGCPRLKPRTGSGRVFTFASVDNSNAGRDGDESGGRFDQAGVLHYIATEGGTSAYVNPHTAGRVVASRSSNLEGGDESFVAGPCPGDSYTHNIPNSWMAVDLGAGRRLTVNHYALRYGVDDDSGAPRNWELQGSEDGEAWTTLRRHDNDETMEVKSFVVAHWAVEGVTTPYRRFRVHQHGVNSCRASHNNLICNGIELYGRLY